MVPDSFVQDASFVAVVSTCVTTLSFFGVQYGDLVRNGDYL